MLLLVNYDPPEKAHLNSLEYVLKGLAHEGMTTGHAYTISSIVSVAQSQGCKAIICANTQTLRNLVGDPKATLDKWRGTRFNFAIPVIVINSLTHFFNVNHGEWLLHKDLAKLKTSYVKAAPFRYSVLKHTKDFAKWLKLAQSAIIMGCDIETNQHSMTKNLKSTKRVPCFGENYDIAGLGETWITCLAFTLVMPDLSLETCVLPLVNGTTDFWLRDSDYEQAIAFMRAMLATDAPKCFHNGLYDCFHLIRYGAYPRNWTMDTMGLSHSWYSELPKTLDFLASWTLYDYYYWKDEADAQHKAKDYESYWQYNAKDTWAMCRSLLHLLRIGDTWMFTNYASNFPMVYPSLYCAFEGLRINNDTRKRMKGVAEEKMQALLTELRIMTDDPEFNPGSSTQVSDFIYNVLGASRPPRAKTKAAAGKKDRINLAAQHPLIAMFCDRIDKFNKEKKAVSTYFSFLQWNSRLMYSIDPFGTDSSRMASRGSAGWVGTQIQNQPPYAKYMYEPDPGYIGGEMDYSKAEAVCTAFLSGCVPLMDALADKTTDFYKRLGVLFFQMKIEDVTDDFRNAVLKKIQHGTNYMMGADTFIDNCSVSILNFAAGFLGITITDRPEGEKEMTLRQFAQSLLDSYHVPFPEVSEWWKAVRIEVATTKKLVSPTGHVRYFFGNPIKNHGVFRSAVAHQPQNLSVTKLNQGMWKVYKYMQIEPGVVRLKTQIHDSIKFQVRIERAREVIPVLRELVIARQEVKGRLMQIDVDVEVYHDNWKGKTKWPRFLETTLPMLESQNLLTSTIDGSA
jgi:DNA polymerase I-like protein with 3'-5' exonuclease and polymerase domains